MHANKTDSPSHLLGQLIRSYHQRTHMMLGKLGLYPGQPPILFMLWDKDGCSQRELSDKIFLKPATVTVMLKRMEKVGLLERRTDPVDLRVSRVFLTEKGKHLRHQVADMLNKVEQECLSGFTPDEKVLLSRFLKQMRDNLRNACQL